MNRELAAGQRLGAIRNRYVEERRDVMLVQRQVLVGRWMVFVAICLSLPRPAAPPQATILPQVSVPAAAGGFERALAAAREGRMQACEAVKRAMEQREAEDPAGAAAMDAEAWRHGLLAADRGGAFHRALRAARQASTLARNEAEASRAAVLLVMLECDAGHHREELRQAHRLAALQHRNRMSLSVLLRAARCNELEPLARQLSAEMAARGDQDAE
jgi:hypothetical protein